VQNAALLPLLTDVALEAAAHVRGKFAHGRRSFFGHLRNGAADQARDMRRNARVELVERPEDCASPECAPAQRTTGFALR
jgi:hypothetical protein